MLSAAHVLAMDAKNLLDVVDSIRLRFPDLFLLPGPTKPVLPSNHDQYHYEIHAQQSESISCSQQQRNEDSYEIMSHQTYQNIADTQLETSPSQSASPPILSERSGYQTDQLIYANNQSGNGIYDNECIISAQMNSSDGSDQLKEVVNSESNDAVTGASDPPAKPPVAAKPTNLQSKFKVPFNSHIENSSPPAIAEKTPLHDEPLKIIEQDTELYCNSGTAID